MEALVSWSRDDKHKEKNEFGEIRASSVLEMRCEVLWSVQPDLSSKADARASQGRRLSWKRSSGNHHSLTLKYTGGIGKLREKEQRSWRRARRGRKGNPEKKNRRNSKRKSDKCNIQKDKGQKVPERAWEKHVQHSGKYGQAAAGATGAFQGLDEKPQNSFWGSNQNAVGLGMENWRKVRMNSSFEKQE